MKKVLLAAAILATASGCATQTYIVNGGGDLAPEYDEAQHFFVAGIGQEQTVDAAQVCGGEANVAQTETEITFINGLLSTLTLGIYSPRQARVYCK